MKKLEKFDLLPVSLSIISHICQRESFDRAETILDMISRHIEEKQVNVSKLPLFPSFYAIFKHYAYSDQTKLVGLMRKLQKLSIMIDLKGWFFVLQGMIQRKQWEQSVKLIFSLEDQEVKIPFEMYLYVINALIRRASWLALLKHRPQITSKQIIFQIRHRNNFFYTLPDDMETDDIQLRNMANQVLLHMETMNYDLSNSFLRRDGSVGFELKLKELSDRIVISEHFEFAAMTDEYDPPEMENGKL